MTDITPTSTSDHDVDDSLVNVFFKLFNVRLPVMTMTVKQLMNTTLFLDQYKSEYTLMKPVKYDEVFGAFMYAPNYVMLLTSDYEFMDICLTDTIFDFLCQN